MCVLVLLLRFPFSSFFLFLRMAQPRCLYMLSIRNRSRRYTFGIFISFSDLSIYIRTQFFLSFLHAFSLFFVPLSYFTFLLLSSSTPFLSDSTLPPQMLIFRFNLFVFTFVSLHFLPPPSVTSDALQILLHLYTSSSSPLSPSFIASRHKYQLRRWVESDGSRDALLRLMAAASALRSRCFYIR